MDAAFTLLDPVVMRESKSPYVVLSRVRPGSVGFLVLFSLFVSTLSCDEVDRHRSLTFFFDGVPPLGAEGLPDGAVTTSSRDMTRRPEAVWYIHEPRKDCIRCHGTQEQRSFSREVKLTARIPDLCYECHEGLSALEGWVHGPVATGDCIFCHEPHRTRNRFLLKRPIPDICYQCHESESIGLIEKHDTELYSRCDRCHSGHASTAKYLLKEEPSEAGEALDSQSAVGQVDQGLTRGEIARRKIGIGEPTEESLSVAKQLREQAGEGDPNQLERLLETTRTRVLEGKGLSGILSRVNELVDQGRLHIARAYLEQVKDWGVFTDEQQGKVAEALDLVAQAEAHMGKTKQAAAVTKQIPQLPTVRPKEADSQQDRAETKKGIAELYYRSVGSYRAGRLNEAKEGFIKVLKSGMAPVPLAEAIERYLADIENTLVGRAKSSKPG